MRCKKADASEALMGDRSTDATLFFHYTKPRGQASGLAATRGKMVYLAGWPVRAIAEPVGIFELIPHVSEFLY
jgi:hypothetical protein